MSNASATIAAIKCLNLSCLPMCLSCLILKNIMERVPCELSCLILKGQCKTQILCKDGLSRRIEKERNIFAKETTTSHSFEQVIFCDRGGGVFQTQLS